MSIRDVSVAAVTNTKDYTVQYNSYFLHFTNQLSIKKVLCGWPILCVPVPHPLSAFLDKVSDCSSSVVV